MHDWAHALARYDADVAAAEREIGRRAAADGRTAPADERERRIPSRALRFLRRPRGTMRA